MAGIPDLGTPVSMLGSLGVDSTPTRVRGLRMLSMLSCRLAPTEEGPDMIQPGQWVGSSLAEHARRVAKAARDDHANGQRCHECTDDGCRRLSTWGPTIERMGADLD